MKNEFADTEAAASLADLAGPAPKLTRNQKAKRFNTLFAVKEWSDRDPDLEWYQLGGLHFSPLPGEKHQPKVQCDHAAQARYYAAISRLLNAETGYTEAVHQLLDLAAIGLQLRNADPSLYRELADWLSERRRAIRAQVEAA